MGVWSHCSRCWTRQESHSNANYTCTPLSCCHLLSFTRHYWREKVRARKMKSLIEGGEFLLVVIFMRIFQCLSFDLTDSTIHYWYPGVFWMNESLGFSHHPYKNVCERKTHGYAFFLRISRVFVRFIPMLQNPFVFLRTYGMFDLDSFCLFLTVFEWSFLHYLRISESQMSSLTQTFTEKKSLKQN